MGYRAVGEFIPLYALYALLFADHGLDGTQISVLLAIWSATAFILEVPSGAWADTVSRRRLLILSGALLSCGFATWTLTAAVGAGGWVFTGYAVGFVLWGVSGALQSGTFEALLYDELQVRDSAQLYPRVIGYSRAATETAVLLGILAAAPLFALGGYALVGWTSVAIALVHCGLAIALPRVPKTASAGDIAELADDGIALPGPADPPPHPLTRYVTMLKTGVREALSVRVVRGGVLLSAIMYGYTAFDEYFGLLAGESGASRVMVPLLVALTVAGSLIGSAFGGRASRLSIRVLTTMVVSAGGAFTAGSLLGGTGPIGVLGFCLIAIAYAAVYTMVVVSESRLQDSISGPARATVTSVAGLLAELIALAVFAFVGIVTAWLMLAETLALLGIPLALTALAVLRWLPRAVPQHRCDESEG